jgi:glyoxylase-like metal-dependent hydrolase (beta-lactamase superfamily II)
MNLRLLALSILLAAASAAPAQQGPGKFEIKSTRLAGNLYLLQGGGGNVAASVGADGVLLVDAEVTALADELHAAVKRLAPPDKPVRFVINTHYHGDHTGGNLLFAQGGAVIVAQEALRARLAGGTEDKGSGGQAKAADPLALPSLTFDHALTVYLNGEEIRAVHYPNAHTDGDSIIFFRKANVVHMGDIYVRYGFPYIDVNAGGSVQGMIGACEEVMRTSPADVRIIPGHGDLAGIGELREYLKMLEDTTAAVANALKAGKTLEQMKHERLLGAWSERYAPPKAFVDTDGFTEALFNSLQRHAARHGHRPR